MKPSKELEIEPILISIKDASRLLGIGRTKLYELISADKLETRRIDTRNLILYSSIKSYVQNLQA